MKQGRVKISIIVKLLFSPLFHGHMVACHLTIGTISRQKSMNGQLGAKRQ